MSDSDSSEILVPHNPLLLRMGRQAWAVIGISIVAVGVFILLAGLSGLVVPLVVAAVVGTLFVPAVDLLATHMNRAVAAALIMLGIIVVAIGAVAVAVAGIVDQAPQIKVEITAGLGALRDWLAGLGLDLPSSSSLAGGLGDILEGSMEGGFSAFLSGAFSSVASFLAGTFVGLFILFYILADWRVLSGWVGSNLGVPPDLGAGMVDDATWSIRRYFSVLTVTGMISAVAIGLTVALMGLPLALTIGLVTFVTSYVPYIGALVSGAFAVLIALGAGGITEAIIVLVVILAVQNVLQPLLQNRMTSSELNLHPVVAFSSTIVGGAVAGVLGATLSAPVLSMVLRIKDRVQNYQPPTAQTRPPPGPDPLGAGAAVRADEGPE